MGQKLKTVAEIAELYGVTHMAVRHWIKKGLKTQTERVIGIKPRMVIDPDDVKKFLGLKDG
jgi:predicted transcriptional regulator